MPGSLTRYGEQLALNLLFRKTGTAPTDLFLGLATAEIYDTSTLATISEVVDTHYNRQLVSFTAPAVGADNKTAIQNTVDVSFGPWANISPSAITHCFVCDVIAGTSGNILAWLALDVPKTPGQGDMLVFYANGLVFTLD